MEEWDVGLGCLGLIMFGVMGCLGVVGIVFFFGDEVGEYDDDE